MYSSVEIEQIYLLIQDVQSINSSSQNLIASMILHYYPFQIGACAITHTQNTIA